MMNAPAGGRGGLVRTGLAFLKFFLTFRGVLSITLILVILLHINALQDSWEQKSVLPFAQQVGGELLNHDTSLYLEAQKIESAGGIPVLTKYPGTFWGKIKYVMELGKSLGRIFLSLWYLYFFFWLYYRIALYFFTADSSKKPYNVLVAVFLLGITQVLGGLVVVDPALQGQTDDLSLLQKMTPFKGVAALVRTTPLWSVPAYNFIAHNDFVGVELPDSGGGVVGEVVLNESVVGVNDSGDVSVYVLEVGENNTQVT